jgi:RNA polymerase sigma-70 factor (ECF subfamily)
MVEMGVFEPRYRAFLESIADLRPRLHRYCSRMTGSIMDGEDMVQDALFRAYRNLDSFDDNRPVAPWLFRIAHNQCIDFLRRRGLREQVEAAVAKPAFLAPGDSPAVGSAIERLVLNLPPKERACVLLKDVFEYSLEEIAELVDSTVGGVKAALNRGRSKLVSAVEPSVAPRDSSIENKNLLHLYVEKFNRRDWDGLLELISADARLRVADQFSGRLADSPYFGNYERWGETWRLAVGQVDGEPSIIILTLREAMWKPRGIARLDIVSGRIQRIFDCLHCPWILCAGSVVLEEGGPESPALHPGKFIHDVSSAPAGS